MKISYDKCFICGYLDFSESFPEDEVGHEYCPVCGSKDIEDAGMNPYNDESGSEGGILESE